jgi:hypothetical protein
MKILGSLKNQTKKARLNIRKIERERMLRSQVNCKKVTEKEVRKN